jgi:hypothetical protein
LEERSMFRNILLDTEIQRQNKIDFKRKLKLDDKVYLDFNSFVNDENSSRGQKKNKANPVFMSPQSAVPKSRLNKLNDENEQYKKEYEEKMEAIKKSEQEKLIKKQLKIQEINEVLEKQVVEKKQKKQEIVQVNRKFEDLIKKDLEKYKIDVEKTHKLTKDKYSKYMSELKQQIDDRFNNKQIAISETERKMNKRLLNKI